MANAERDEVDLTVGDKVYTLVLTTNAMCEAETAMSTVLRPVTFADLLIQSKRNSVAAMRAIFWASLKEKHPEITLQQAGDLMDKAGGTKTFAEKFAAMVFAAVPAESDLKALGIEAPKDRPRKASRKRAGTGKNSVAKLDSLA